MQPRTLEQLSEKSIPMIMVAEPISKQIRIRASTYDEACKQLLSAFVSSDNDDEYPIVKSVDICVDLEVHQVSDDVRYLSKYYEIQCGADILARSLANTGINSSIMIMLAHDLMRLVPIGKLALVDKRHWSENEELYKVAVDVRIPHDIPVESNSTQIGSMEYQDKIYELLIKDERYQGWMLHLGVYVEWSTCPKSCQDCVGPSY